MSLLIIYISTLNTYAIDIQIGIQDNSPVDIILTGGDTDFDYEGFAEKLTTELVAAGVAEERINIWADDVKIMSSNDVGAATIFNSWQKYPRLGGKNFDAGWKLEGDRIYTTANVHWTGFWDLVNEDAEDYTIWFKCMTTQHQDPWGFTFRMKETAYDRYQFYALELDPCDSTITLAKITDWKPDGSDPTHGGPLYHHTISAADGSYHGEFGGALRYCSGTKLVSVRDPVIYGLWDSFEIQCKKNNIVILRNGREIINYTDNNEPFLEGGYGPYTASQYNTSYKDVTIQIGKLKDLVEAVRESEWRTNSSRFIVDVCDQPREDFGIPEKVGELTQRMLANDAYYIGWGRDESKSSMQSFIQHNSNKGIFFDNTNPNIYRDTANYIEPIVNNRQALNGRVYLYKDKDYLFTQD